MGKQNQNGTETYQVSILMSYHELPNTVQLSIHCVRDIVSNIHLPANQVQQIKKKKKGELFLIHQ